MPNLVLVWTSIAVIFGVGTDQILLYVFGLAVVLGEAPLFLPARTTWRRAAVIYLGFLVFCWSFTLLDLSDFPREIESVKDVPVTLAGLVARGFAFVVFGHVFALPALAVALAANLFVLRGRGGGDRQDGSEGAERAEAAL